MTTVEVDSCAHPNRTLLSPWELLRKYVCADCGAVITCACDQEIATFVTPHQATYGRDQFTRDEVMVTHLLVPGVCYNCRGEIPPSFPKAGFRGGTSNILRHADVVVDATRASSLVSQDRHVQVLPLDATDPTKAVRVEDFVTDILQTRGREVMFCESRPFQALC